MTTRGTRAGTQTYVWARFFLCQCVLSDDPRRKRLPAATATHGYVRRIRVR